MIFSRTSVSFSLAEYSGYELFRQELRKIDSANTVARFSITNKADTHICNALSSLKYPYTFVLGALLH